MTVTTKAPKVPTHSQVTALRRAAQGIKNITPIQVLLCRVDTATGNPETQQIELQALDAESLTAWFVMDTANRAGKFGITEENIKYECVAFHTQGLISCFIMAVTGATYFGEFMIHGTVHTDFV